MTTPCWNCGFEIDYNSKSLLDFIEGNLPMLQGKSPILGSQAIVICQIEDIERRLASYLERFHLKGVNNTYSAKMIVPCPKCKELNKEE